MADRVAARVAAGVARRPGRVLALALVLTLLALWPASKLRLETNLAALLPAGHPAAEDYRTFLDAFGGFEKVFLLVLPTADVTEDAAVDDGHLLEAAGRLADLLRESPEVAEVRSGLEAEDEEFFLRFVVRRAPLLLPEVDVDGLASRLGDEAVRAQAASLRAQVHSPTGAAKLTLLRHDPLELSLDLPIFGAAGLDLPVDPVSGGFLARGADDGAEPSVALVMLTPAASEMDPDSGRRLLTAIERARVEMERQMSDEERSESGSESRSESRSDSTSEGIAPGSLRLLALGGPLYAVQDETIIRGDLEATVAGSALGCALLLLLAFGGPRIPIATLTGLGVALLWAAGVLGLLVGELTAPGLGFAAVLVGLGIDYGIHGGVRYRQGRLDGLSATDALAATFRRAGPAIATSAATTAVAFATLGLAHFRPLRELGIVVAVGIVAILLGSSTVGAALATLGRGEPKDSSRTGGTVWRGLDLVSGRAVDLAVRFPVAVLACAGLLSIFALWGVTRLGLSTDMSALRPENHPALEAEDLLSRRFAVGLDTTTLVVRGDDLSETLARSDAAATVLRRAVPGAEVVSPTEWLVAPARRAERLRRLEELPFARAADVLEASLREQNLAPRAFASGLDAMRAFGRGEDPGAPTPEDFPSGLAELIRFEDPVHGSGDVLAALRARLPDGTWPDGPPDEVLRELDEAAPGLAVASVIRLGGALKEIAGHDLEVLLAAALGVVALVVLVAFRGRPLPSLLAMTPVALGSLWTLGLWGALGRDVDLLGLAVVPILLGIGIDDGLHAVHGSHEGGLVASIRHSGLAMTLTTLTTAIGFASLLLSSLPGLQAGGFLVAGGVGACLAATLLVLPALASCGKKGP